MAQKKAARQSTKKPQSSKGSTKSNPKARTSTKQKVAKVKTKIKTPNSKTSRTSKIKKKPVAKAKPKAAKSTKKIVLSKKSANKGSSSTKKKATRQRTIVSKPKTATSKARPKVTHKSITKTSSVKAKPTKHVGLSTIDRYNVGGLLACAIDSAGDSGARRLRKALKHLSLPSQEQENLVRQTQGFMIPRLFSSEIKGEETRKLAVKELMSFAKAEGNYERDWQAEMERIGVWLGIAI